MFGYLFGGASAQTATDNKPKKMKRWVTAQDGINKLKQEEVDTPYPKDGEVLVKIGSVSLNFRDLEGKYT